MKGKVKIKAPPLPAHRFGPLSLLKRGGRHASKKAYSRKKRTARDGG